MAALLIFIVINTTSCAYASNLGVWGAVFTIEEQDIKEFIYARLRQMEQNGQLAKLRTTFITNVKNHIIRPASVAGLTTTDQPKTFYYDPTYVLAKDITDEKDGLIAKAGTIINPFDTIKMSSIWLFFNADDPRQVKWARAKAKQYNYTKYILVSGNIKEAGDLLKDRIYFDQSGVITKQLGIGHIPCLVKQQDKKLQIQEFAIK